MSRSVKLGLLGCLLGFGLLASLGAYTRDVSKDLLWGQLYALEYLINYGEAGSHAEDAAASGGEVGVYCLGVQQDTLADSVSATGDFISFKMDPLGALYIQGPFKEDAGHTSADYGLQIFGVRTDTRASLAGTTADYAPFQLTANGDVRVRDDDLLTAFATQLPAALGAQGALKVEGVANGTTIPVTEASGSTISSRIGTLAGSAATFQTPVAITQAGAGRTTILALEAGKVIYLHALVLTADAAGTVKICYDDDGAGANEVALTGAMPVAANGGFVIPFTSNTNGCLRTASGKQLTLFSVTSKVFGYAIVSKQ